MCNGVPHGKLWSLMLVSTFHGMRKKKSFCEEEEIIFLKTNLSSAMRDIKPCCITNDVLQLNEGYFYYREPYIYHSLSMRKGDS